jgi:hypothetical protein
METDKNQFIDALAILAFTTNIDYENKVQPISVKVKFFGSLLLSRRKSG